MGRKRLGIIEKEENRKTAELTLRLIGNRSFKEVAEETGVDPSTISYITRGRTKPTVKVIQLMTSLNANPQGGVTYEEFMRVAGYVDVGNVYKNIAKANRAEFIGQILDIFEDFLEERNIHISNVDSSCNLCGTDYDDLHFQIDDTLRNWGIV